MRNQESVDFTISQGKRERRSVSILGATGSIGDSTLDIVISHADKYRVVAVTGGENAKKLAAIARAVLPEIVAIADETKVAFLKEALCDLDCKVLGGAQGVLEAAAAPCDMSISAIVGFAGLKPTLAALEACKYLALANKESLVCAGTLVRQRAKENNVALLPLDSEHNAIFQVLNGEKMAAVERVTLTASGGPFRTWTKEEIAKAGPAQALKHPNWDMGAKITIDSATLMNKGLEVIEAFHLFPIENHQLDVVVHPQSIIHGMVSFIDGAVIAELGEPDMRTPIAHCMAHPERLTTVVNRLDLARIGSLTFEKPDTDRFPMLLLARQALAEGDVATNLLNGANEIAVAGFLKDTLSFYDMSAVVEGVVAEGLKVFNSSMAVDTYEIAAEIDAMARDTARRISSSFG